MEAVDIAYLIAKPTVYKHKCRSSCILLARNQEVDSLRTTDTANG